MIYRPFNEAAIYASFDLNGWKTKAELARQRAVTARSAGLNHEFESGLWKELKQHLLDYFFGKCAYCELDITSGFWGDVEHYRPKKKVDDEPGHPGYYWLAYEPGNLMPSCQKCNQGKGKKNRFPVVAGTRALSEPGILSEQALLLTPYVDRPFEHLQFDFESSSGLPTGYVSGKTDKGRVSVDVYGLNRTELVDNRLKAQLDTVTEWQLVSSSSQTLTLNGMDPKPLLNKFISKQKAGMLTFTAARLAALNNWIASENARREEVRNTLGE